MKNGSHDGHEIASDPRSFHEYRHQDQERISQVIEMSDNMLTPLQILRQTGDDDGMPSLTLKDIYNIRENMARTMAGREVTELHDYLVAQAYIIRHTIKETTIDKLFVTHQNCIERAQRFPEVVIIDATYKASTNKMPLVNIVGIDNLSSSSSTLSLRSFYIASAVLTNETKISYNWVLQCLKKVVYDNGRINPGIFVTDDDKGLRAALDIIYPYTPHILCAWHIKRNFESHASGCYKKNSESEEKFLGILDKMIYGCTSEIFESAKKDYYDFVGKTTKAKELRDYLEMLVLHEKSVGGMGLTCYIHRLLSYKERWARLWVERHAHLRARTTQTVEGVHWIIKQIMSTPGRLMKLFKAIHYYLIKNVSLIYCF